jgi:alkylated DNA nucleotide flippase Atl1
VFDTNRRVVGRIMLHPQAPKDQPWFWTITAREIPPSVHNRGYSASREQAMADFKARWPA